MPFLDSVEPSKRAVLDCIVQRHIARRPQGDLREAYLLLESGDSSPILLDLIDLTFDLEVGQDILERLTTQDVRVAISNLLIIGHRQVANDMLDRLVERQFFSHNAARLTQLRSMLSDRKEHDESVLNDVRPERELVQLREFYYPREHVVDSEEPGKTPSRRYWFDASSLHRDIEKPGAQPGAVFEGAVQNPQKEEPKFHYDEKDKEALRRAGFFGRAAPSGGVDNYTVLKRARFSADNPSVMACFDQHGAVLPECCGRLARTLPLVSVKRPVHTLGKALVLPGSHHLRNYYHFMSETAYGMRLLRMVDGVEAIIAPNDEFGILNWVADRMDVPSEKIITYSNASTLTVETALLPSPAPFYWNEGFVGYWRSMICHSPEQERVKIYISRRGSARDISYGESIEEVFREHGFLVLQAQNLSFAEQVDLFSRADVVVGFHGAGFANMAFCPDGVRIIEIFDLDMLLNPVFYFASKQVRADYRALIVNDRDFRHRLEGVL